MIRAYPHVVEPATKVRLESVPPELQISLKFERRLDRGTSSRTVSSTLWKTSDRVREAAQLIEPA